MIKFLAACNLPVTSSSLAEAIHARRGSGGDGGGGSGGGDSEEEVEVEEEEMIVEEWSAKEILTWRMFWIGFSNGFH